MSKDGVTPEMLMALADQELDRDSARAIEEAVREDAALAAQLAMFRATRRAARDTFADVMAEPVPERLVQSVLSEPATQPNVVAFPLRGRWQRAALPLAACFALVAGIAGYFIGQSAFGPASSPLGAIAYGDPAVIEALERTPANAPLKLQAGGAGAATLQIAGSYPVDGGYCRVFSVSSGADSVRGLGCKRGAGWTIEAVAADVAANETGRYRPASGATDLIEAALDSFGAGEPVAPEEEKGLIAVAWKK